MVASPDLIVPLSEGVGYSGAFHIGVTMA